MKTYKEILKSILNAFRQNLTPALCLLSVSFLIITGYYLIPSFNAMLEKLAKIKEQYGYGFAFFSTAVAGGFFPYLINVILKKTNESKLVFLMAFWGVKGVEIDFFYRIQAFWFGDNTRFLTIFTKTAVDQLIYTLFWAIPTMILFFTWTHNLNNPVNMKILLQKAFKPQNYFAFYFSNCMVWCPTVIIIYQLPLALQLPVQNIILCFWSLMVLFFTKAEKKQISEAAV